MGGEVKRVRVGVGESLGETVAEIISIFLGPILCELDGKRSKG